MVDFKERSNVAGKDSVFPMFSFKSEEELLASEMWAEVFQFLKDSRHPRCQCCSEIAVNAIPTKVDSEVYLGMFPGFIATVCQEHFDEAVADRSTLIPNLFKNHHEKTIAKFWRSRHKQGVAIKHEMIILVNNAMNVQS